VHAGPGGPRALALALRGGIGEGGEVAEWALGYVPAGLARSKPGLLGQVLSGGLLAIDGGGGG